MAAEWHELHPGEAPAAPAGAATYRVIYPAPGARGEVTMSGLVTVPESTAATEAGTAVPLLSFAHGTTGISTSSAPSLYKDGDPIGRYIERSTVFLQSWVDAGFTVLQPDYEGLGVEEVGGTYLHRVSSAGAINGLVEAAKEKFNAQHWVNVGYSQGGYSALAAADNPTEGLVGTVAIAPGDTELVNKNLRIMGIGPVDVARMLSGRAVRFFPIVLASAMNAFEDVDGDAFLSDLGRELVAKANTLTLPELEEEVEDISGGDLFFSNADTTVLQARLDEQRLELMHPQGPVLVLVGNQDTTINREHVIGQVNAWEAAGVEVKYVELDGVGHGKSISEAQAPIHEWVAQRDGRAAR